MRRLISLGGNCEVAYQIKLHTGKNDADYFDWLIIAVESVMRALTSRFDGMLDRDQLSIHDDELSVVNASTGVMYFHDYPNSQAGVVKDFLMHHDRVISRYGYLSQKFLAMADAGERPVTFVRNDISADQCRSLMHCIRTTFPNLEFDLIVVNRQGVTDYREFRQPDVLFMEVQKSNADGLGISDDWCKGLVGLGVIEDGFKKAHHEIVKTDEHQVYID